MVSLRAKCCFTTILFVTHCVFTCKLKECKNFCIISYEKLQKLYTVVKIFESNSQGLNPTPKDYLLSYFLFLIVSVVDLVIVVAIALSEGEGKILHAVCQQLFLTLRIK